MKKYTSWFCALLLCAYALPVGAEYFNVNARNLIVKESPYVDVRAYGADSTGATDSSAAIQAAIDVVKARTTGGTVYLPSGTYLINTTLNLSNINPASYNYSSNKAVTLRGAGMYQTYLTGGEVGFGLIDIVGSNYITLEGFTIRSDVATQYGIIGGRKAGDASSGKHVFKNIFIHGSFTEAAMFMMSSEVNYYENIFVYTTSGKGLVLARDITGWTASAKHTALSSTALIAGGNGGNQLINCDLFTYTANATDYPLVLEYVQTFFSQNLETYSDNATAHIFFRKMGTGIIFDGLHQEYGTVEPWGMYFAAAYASPSLPHFRDLSVRSSRVYGIYGEDNTAVANLNFQSQMRGAKDNAVDLYDLYGSTINHDNTLASVTSQTASQYRVRNISSLNDFGTTEPPDLIVKDHMLNAVSRKVSLGTLYDLALSFNRDKGITNYGGTDNASGVVATVDASVRPADNSFALYADVEAVDSDSPIVSLSTDNTSGAGSNYFLLWGISGDLRVTLVSGGNSIVAANTDFLSGHAGQRVRLLAIRDGDANTLAVYANGYPITMTTVGTPTGTWGDSVTGTYFKTAMGGGLLRYPGVIYDAALLNFAPTAAQAKEISKYGITAPYRWGSAVDGSDNGAVLQWDFSAGTGATMTDLSGLTQTGTLDGDAAWGKR